ncbi:helix-hairpin-helix domain-containing protein [Halalkalicoccus tibetensis]|uniref:Helix-hairpin-helix domain-containing protein n=1 Tax=Halalkalicoccus tibetensis TaxID=175632 RepID=A0ABD5UX78_9EURY
MSCGRHHRATSSTGTERKGYPVERPYARNEPTAKRMYGCIEGIGPELAERLYEAHPSVAALSGASIEELCALEGIGEARARRIRGALRGG